jgi:hypothetical protein
MTADFVPFPKMARLTRDCLITEKLDGTNAQVCITDDGEVLAGSRNRWVTPQSDNAGFARWVAENADELRRLGPGRHFGEWWGRGIQRNYGLTEKRFTLFNASRWLEDSQPVADLPSCCSVVPVLYRGVFTTDAVDFALYKLRTEGSVAAPGFMRPEGVVVFHIAAGVGFKKLLENDELPKSLAA